MNMKTLELTEDELKYLRTIINRAQNYNTKRLSSLVKRFGDNAKLENVNQEIILADSIKSKVNVY